MTTFYIRSRRLGPMTVESIDAATRDEAISQLVQSAADGEEIAVMETSTSPIFTSGRATEPEEE